MLLRLLLSLAFLISTPALSATAAGDSLPHKLPHPTIFIIDANGIVRTILAEKGYKNRPSLDAILGTIQ